MLSSALEQQKACLLMFGVLSSLSEPSQLLLLQVLRLLRWSLATVEIKDKLQQQQRQSRGRRQLIRESVAIPASDSSTSCKYSDSSSLSRVQRRQSEVECSDWSAVRAVLLSSGSCVACRVSALVARVVLESQCTTSGRWAHT
jgi:hypothetical protein